jgi:hypothetical protein
LGLTETYVTHPFFEIKVTPGGVRGLQKITGIVPHSKGLPLTNLISLPEKIRKEKGILFLLPYFPPFD